MTGRLHFTKIKDPRKLGSISPGSIAFCIMSIFFLTMTLLRPHIAIASTARGMELCAKTLIPSLFPFMVISDILVSSGALSLLGRPLHTPMRKLFGISGDGGCAVIIGILCGFPVGTKTAVALYEERRISKNELEHVLMLCNLPSSAFLINAVGISLFGSHTVGLLLYLANIVSTLIIGLVSKAFFEIPDEPPANAQRDPRKSGVSIFTSAITSSATGMLYVCAFVVFFSTLVGSLEAMIAGLSLPDVFTPLWFGFFEMTQGVTKAALCSSRQLGLLSTAIVSGWSGLSVHFQIMSLCQSHALSFRPYFISKLMSAIINSAIFTAAMTLFPSLLRS